MYGMRPREAFRRALGWTLQEAADRFNAHMRRDVAGDAPREHVQLTASRLCDFEGWPLGGRKPRPYVLTGLAAIYGTNVASLLDYEDHANLTADERLALSQTRRIRWAHVVRVRADELPIRRHQCPAVRAPGAPVPASSWSWYRTVRT